MNTNHETLLLLETFDKEHLQIRISDKNNDLHEKIPWIELSFEKGELIDRRAELLYRW